jgi:hypothetical protein
MPADFALSSPDSDKCPKSDSAELGHFEATWDIEQSVNLTDLQLRAIEFTVQGHSDSQIAEMLSIDRKTLWRWKTLNDEYRYVLASARSQVHAAAGDRCQNLLFRATAVLARFLEDPADKNRMRAAQILLQTAGRIRPVPQKQPPQPAVSDGWPEAILPPKVG